MSGTAAEIPKRASFKASEVCQIAELQPYVLRSWEAEFPNLGVAKAADGVRVYRRVDVELVLRLKHLLFVDGLTLGGARRKIQEEQGSTDEPAAEDVLAELVGPQVRDRLDEVKRGLHGILEMLSSNGGGASPPGPERSALRAVKKPRAKPPESSARRRKRTRS